MKKIIIPVLIICMHIIAMPSKAQTSSNLSTKADYPHPITPAPNAASLGKYGETPVSLFSGLPQIDIPLYNLKVGDITVPISLSYHASGIKVDDIASDVGLGWALNAGGVITRTIQGLPDGANDGLYPGESFNPNLQPVSGGNDQLPDYQIGKSLITDNKDLERDIYYYNFLNISGKFMIDRNGGVNLLPANPNLRIETTGVTAITAFTITDDKGFKYYFTVNELSRDSSSCPIQPNGLQQYTNGFTSSWYLSKVVSPNNHQIIFEYEAHEFRVVKSFSETYYQQPVLSAGCTDLSYKNQTCLQTQIMSGLRLKKIYADDNSSEIDFNYATTKRLDLDFNNQHQGNYLTNVQIYSNIPSAHLLKTWTLGYDYFAQATNPRLKLISVSEDTKPPYEFTYNETNPLPARLSFAQDHWGYSNGQSLNNTFIPAIPEINRITGANREPDFTYMPSGALMKMKYPTGGYTTFEYEPHKDLITETTTSFVQEFASLDNQGVGSTNDFLLPGNATNLHFGWNVHPINFDDVFSASLLGGANYSTLYLYAFNGDGDIAVTPSLSANNVAPGNYYRLSLNSNNLNDRGDVYLLWQRPVTTTTTHEKILIGGLRIKSTTDFDANNQQITSKFYSYNWVNNPTKSSVVLPADAVNTYYSTYQIPNINTNNGQPFVDGYCNYLILSSSSVPSLGGVLHSTLGYKQIVEQSDINGINGRTIYRYDAGGPSGTEGTLLEKADQQFNATNSSYFNVSKMRHSYLVPTANQVSIPNMKISYTQPEMLLEQGNLPHVNPAVFDVEKYYIVSAKYLLQNSYDISYANQGNDSLLVHTSYSYDNAAYNYPTAIVKENSRGEQIKTENKYVIDMAAVASPQTVYQTMQSRNIIAPVVEQKVLNLTKANEPIYDKITDYADWSNGVIQPANIKTAYYGSSTFNNDLIFNKYDNWGNLLSFSPNNSPAISYAWGYNQQYPIAECKNAANDEFFTQNFEEVSGAAAGGHTGLQYYNGSYTTGDKLAPNYHGKSYVISYWYTNGSGAWTYSGEMPYTGQTLSGNIDDVRIYPKDAQVTTYTYSPLVGMTSATDAKGQTTTYEYDSFQRLLNIRDQYGNIVKHTDYHYQNQ